MFTCSRCSFQHPFEWAMNEHIYVKHGIVTDMTPRGEIPFPSTKLRVVPDGGCAPTTVSVPSDQSGMGIEDSKSEHGDTDEEAVDDTCLCLPIVAFSIFGLL